MNREQLIERLMSTFLPELDEHVRAFERDLLALEKSTTADERRALLLTLFRTAHSLKGASRAVDLREIETACHQLESFLEHALESDEAISQNRIQLLLSVADALRDAGEKVQKKESLAGSPLVRLLPQIGDLASTGERPAPAARGRSMSNSRRETGETLSSSASGSRSAEGSRPAAGSPTVPIPADKLDRLLLHGGELLTARHRTASAVGELETLQSSLRLSRREWTRVEAALYRLGTRQEHEDDRSIRDAVELATRHSAALARLERDLDRSTGRVIADHDALHSMSTTIGDDLRAIRMSPFAEACQGLDRVARDTAHDQAKLVRFEIAGGEIELDRVVLDAIRSSLIQLVRNAVTHGIELPDERQRLGKPKEARVTIAAQLAGGRVEVTVRDDGRGIDRAAIRRVAESRGFPLPENEEEIERLIFEPGFSTASGLTETAGRGVGLDLVRSRVESVHGDVSISSAQNRGTTFTLSVPLTLSSVRVLLVRTGGELVALESSRIVRLVRVKADQMHSVERRSVVLIDGHPIPLADLSALIGFGFPPSSSELKPVVILADGAHQVGLVVDEALSEEEVVVKTLGERTAGNGYASAATLLPDGDVALILNASALSRDALEFVHGRTPGFQQAETSEAKRRLLVVDDSVTTRTLEKSILEEAGFEVMVAADGRDAWEILQRGRPDLVITDVEMPEMNGIELTEAIRKSPALRTLPVILLTSRESEADRSRGMTAGADAYLVKSAFDRSLLLDVISQLI